MTLLQIVTRCHPNRPNLQYVNQRSVKRLGLHYERMHTHTLIHDNEGQGVPWANAQLAQLAHGKGISGDYVWILDDDDECIFPDLLHAVQVMQWAHDADVIIARADHGERHGILPDDSHWRQAPEAGCIGMSNFIVRRYVFIAHAGRFETKSFADYNFIRAVWDAGNVYRWAWLNQTIMRTQQGALFGAAE